jgi:hypothetical protein
VEGVKAFAIVAGCVLVIASTLAFAADSVKIDTNRNTDRERQTKAELEKIIASYDLNKYIFTRKVVVEEKAMNHAFPTLTLNVRFLNSDDELLSSFLHEQLHWYLRDHSRDMEAAVAQLKRFYPHVPVGLPEGADTEYSTYGHLVDCYLEIQADRALIGRERTDAVIRKKPWYLWIYKTEIEDEPRIAAVVKAQGLDIP